MCFAIITVEWPLLYPHQQAASGSPDESAQWMLQKTTVSCVLCDSVTLSRRLRLAVTLVCQKNYTD